MRRKMSGIATLFLAVVLMLSLFGCGGAGTTSGTQAVSSASGSSASTADPVKETVKISVFMGNGGSNLKVPIGDQTDPVAKEILNKTGVQIVITRLPQKDVAAQVNTMLASNDLDDLTYVAGDYAQDISKNVISAAKSGEILALDDLVAQNAPDWLSNPTLKARLDFNKKYASEDGKLYAIPELGGTTVDTRPSDGIFIRWDLYKQLGYPAINNDDDLLKVMSDMLKLEPKTKEGKTVYGTGGWFAEGSGWGEALMRYGYAWSRGFYGYPDLVAYYDCLNRNMYVKNAVTDTSSPYWNGVKFAYKLQKAGLLDPDTAIQKYDKADEKLKNGQYLMFFSGWTFPETKAYFASSGQPDKGFVALPAFSGAANIQAMVNETSGMCQLVVAKSCKNPDRAIQLLNYLATAEGSRLAHSGIKGTDWDIVNGVPALTDAYSKQMETSTDVDGLQIQTGVGRYGGLTPWLSGCISPYDNAYFNLAMQPDYLSKNYTNMEKDAIAHYNAKSLQDIYLGSSVKSATTMFINYDSMFPPMDDQLKTAAANINTYCYKNEFKCIFAKSDAEFDAAQKALIDGVSKFNPDDVYKYYTDNMAKAKAALDPVIDEAAKTYLFK